MEPLKIEIASVLKDKNPKLYRRLPGFVIRYLERIVHQKEINAFFAKNGHLTNHAFCDAVVKELNLSITFHGLEKIPKTGPIILVMNHPLGGIDGLAFVASLQEHRKDLIFLVNDILMQVKPMEEMFVGVNKHGKNTNETWNNIADLFNSDNAVCIFPAGLVSRKDGGIIQDGPWKRTFVTYAKKTGHPILPIHIQGKLSPWFYGLYKFRKMFGIKSAVEMLYLADELFKQRNKSVNFTVGEMVIIPQETPISDQQWADNLKQTLYLIPQQHGTNHP